MPKRVREATAAERVAARTRAVLAALDAVVGTKDAALFTEPVDAAEAGAEDYYDRIAVPVDLSLIRRRVARGMYAEAALPDPAAGPLGSIHDDVALLHLNSAQFNGADHWVTNVAARLAASTSAAVDAALRQADASLEPEPAPKPGPKAEKPQPKATAAESKPEPKKAARPARKAKGKPAAVDPQDLAARIHRGLAEWYAELVSRKKNNLARPSPPAWLQVLCAGVGKHGRGRLMRKESGVVVVDCAALPQPLMLDVAAALGGGP